MRNFLVLVITQGNSKFHMKSTASTGTSLYAMPLSVQDRFLQGSSPFCPNFIKRNKPILFLPSPLKRI